MTDARTGLLSLQRLTQERLERVDRRSSVCDLAVFGWFGGPGIWFIHSYHKSSDIVEGYLAIHPAYGESEHGSILGKDVLRAAEITDFSEITFKEAMQLDYDSALALVTGRAQP